MFNFLRRAFANISPFFLRAFRFLLIAFCRLLIINIAFLFTPSLFGFYGHGSHSGFELGSNCSPKTLQIFKNVRRFSLSTFSKGLAWITPVFLFVTVNPSLASCSLASSLLSKAFNPTRRRANRFSEQILFPAIVFHRAWDFSERPAGDGIIEGSNFFVILYFL